MMYLHSVNKCNSTNSETVFHKTITYWWRGKTTRWRAATGASRDRASIDRHRNWAGCRRNTDEEKHYFVVPLHNLSERKVCQYYYVFVFTKNSHLSTHLELPWMK